ncbi:MAG: dihydroorotate dehydrogenase electron transfer subunit [Thermoleophilaceae bacterium]|jgi:NAD(P)H-flavin reductase|nr:dihydroorotate dehydrogenase electron transfer subunit [Thermoleophilaceae bacterium]
MTEGPRTLAPFGRRLLRVIKNERLGAYNMIWVAEPQREADPQPGQFYMLATERQWGGEDGRPFLPRAFSFARCNESALAFLLEAIGPGTSRLARLQRDDGVWVTGPLGMGFTAPGRGRALLVGGGIGAAPLLCWRDVLGADTTTLLGFRSAQHAEARNYFAGAQVATDDGSVGHHGFVTELLREELDRDADATIYACGPPPMLEAVRALAAEREVPAQLAMESGMACGFGACMGCVVQTRNGYVRLCVDGPVVDASELETAWVPGAPH